MPPTLLVDNYDSYTFNLYQLIAEVNGEPPIVVRNDERQLGAEDLRCFASIVISPGPGHPARERDLAPWFGLVRDSSVPTLGVCLGHQGLGHAFGGRVIHAPEVMHGRISPVFHDRHPLMDGIPQGFQAVRYHSLVLASPLPSELRRIAWSEDGVVMGVAHIERPLFGVQFHPESIASEHGRRLLENFRELARAAHPMPRPLQRSSVGGLTVVPSRASTPEQAASGLRVMHRTLAGARDAEAVFAGLFGAERCAFWLDSSRAESGLARFSYMGVGKGRLSHVVRYDVEEGRIDVSSAGDTWSLKTDLFDYLQARLEEIRCDAELPFDFIGGYVGFLGYELKADCGGSFKHRSPQPDAMLLFADRLVVFDHLEDTTYLVALDESDDIGAVAWLAEAQRRVEALVPSPLDEEEPNGECALFKPTHGYEEYVADIGECRKALIDGESYEICLTTQLKADVNLHPLELYRGLRRINPAPHAAFLRFDDLHVLSSSPELFLRVDRARRAEAKPIKGTAARGVSAAEDEDIVSELTASIKNRAENLMIVDLLRNDLGLVSEVGSVRVPALMAVESYETVHHLVSTICGQLRGDVATLDCIRACFPAGSMTGAPKKRTTEIIDALETEARGIYSGSLGFIGVNGTCDLSVAIRTLVLDGEMASLGCGGAITVQSDADEEFSEALLKARSVLRAIPEAMIEDDALRLRIDERSAILDKASLA